jgi:hypothetical protein
MVRVLILVCKRANIKMFPSPEMGHFLSVQSVNRKLTEKEKSM